MRTDTVALIALGLVCGAKAAPTYSCFDPPSVEDQTNPLGEGMEDVVEDECCEALVDTSDIEAGRFVVWDSDNCNFGAGEDPIASEPLCFAHDVDGCRFCRETCEDFEGLCLVCSDIMDFGLTTASPTPSSPGFTSGSGDTPAPAAEGETTPAPFGIFPGTPAPTAAAAAPETLSPILGAAPETPAPVAETTPAPITEATPMTPAPVMPETPAPTMPETPAPVTETTPETPAPVDEAAPETPAPVMPVTPAPVTDTAEETPAPVMDASAETPAPAMESEECDCEGLMSETEMEVLETRGKRMVCDETCSDGTDAIWGVMNCNYFALGQNCRACSDFCEDNEDGTWLDQDGAFCKPCDQIES